MLTHLWPYMLYSWSRLNAISEFLEIVEILHFTFIFSHWDATWSSSTFFTHQAFTCKKNFFLNTEQMSIRRRRTNSVIFTQFFLYIISKALTRQYPQVKASSLYVWSNCTVFWIFFNLLLPVLKPVRTLSANEKAQSLLKPVSDRH